jgi:hypothetical protein
MEANLIRQKIGKQNLFKLSAEEEFVVRKKNIC